MVTFYEFWFDYQTYQDLFRYGFKENSFALMGWTISGLSLILLFIFYKFWDPVQGQRKKWFFTLLINSVINFVVSLLILYNNQGLIQAIGNHIQGEVPNPLTFVFQISAISALYALIVSVVLCLTPLPVKIFSNDNTKNPF